MDDKRLKLAKEALESGSYDKETIEYIFPELKESEDEKIRKALIEYYSFDKAGSSHALDNITPKQVVAWLEKQGKLKSNWSENDEKIRNELLPIIRRYIGYIEEESCELHLKDFFIKEAEEVIDWLEEQVKQKSEWSTVDRDTPNWIGNK